MTTQRNRPETTAELAALIDAIATIDRTDPAAGYEQSANAMWKAAQAAFDYTARAVGATGFQASIAALRFYGEVMRVRGPFMIVQLEDALYPQNDLPGRVTQFLDEQAPWLAEQAAEKLAVYEAAHPNVVAHWRRLVANGGLR